MSEARVDMTVGEMRAVVSAAGVDDDVFHVWLDRHDRELWEAAFAQGRGAAGEGI